MRTTAIQEKDTLLKKAKEFYSNPGCPDCKPKFFQILTNIRKFVRLFAQALDFILKYGNALN